MADPQTTPPDGQAPSSWDSAVGDLRDMGLKYMNAALNAAGNQGGGITRNQFNFPPAPATQSTAQPPGTTPQALTGGLSGLAKTGLAAAGIFGTGGFGVGIAALMGAFSAAAPVATTLPTPTAVVQPAGQVTIGINSDGTLYDPSKPNP